MGKKGGKIGEDLNIRKGQRVICHTEVKEGEKIIKFEF